MAWFRIWAAPLLAAAQAHGSEPQAGSAMANLMQRVPFPLLMSVAALAFLATLVASKFARKLQVPAILGVLLLGVAINPEEQIFGAQGVENLHIISLTMLLFYAGLKTNIQQIRRLLGYGLLLAIGGVIVSSLIFGSLIHIITVSFNAIFFKADVGTSLLSPLPLSLSMLVAACLGSTDAGATLSVLSSVSRYVPQRVRLLLEFESSVNDPAAILFLSLILGLCFKESAAAQALNDITVGGMAGQIQTFIKQIGSGIMVGLLLTYVSQYILRHFITSKDQILIVGIAIAMAAYGFSAQLGGSGFITVYVTGLFLANDIYENPLITSETLENSLESFNTLMEMMVFLLFGVIINPANILIVLPQGILAALALMFIARPLSVLAFSRVSPFNWRENVLISWCGLRGAVPLALSYVVIHAIPELPGVSPEAIPALRAEVEGMIFVVVLMNLCFQGLSLPWLSRRLGLQGESTETAATAI
ncbi:MAG: hypothetical protein RLZZ336_1856 [Cyanobacteriota bacterium]